MFPDVLLNPVYGHGPRTFRQTLAIPIRAHMPPDARLIAFVAMFLRAGVVGLPLGSVLGPAILLRALVTHVTQTPAGVTVPGLIDVACAVEPGGLRQAFPRHVDGEARVVEQRERACERVRVDRVRGLVSRTTLIAEKVAHALAK